MACSRLLATDTTSHPCTTNADCAPYPDAVCDNYHHECTPRLPYASAGVDAEAPDGNASDGMPGPICQLSFDNSNRVPSDGADGGLRPLPEEP